MSAVRPALEIAHPAGVPRLLVELPSWPRVFFGNLRDLLFPRSLAPLELRSAPAPFWHDVFVERPLPWVRFAQSWVYHVLAGAAIVGLAHLFALQPRVVPTPEFEHSQVIYYQPSEYLPPLDTRSESSAEAAKADPEFSKQPIISVPRESDNRSQTIVTPPTVKLKGDVSLPNVVAWADTRQRPRLDIPPAPLTPAAEIQRLTPNLENAVAAPPSDTGRADLRHNAPTLQDTVAAPPSDLRGSNSAAVQALQPALVAPPSLDLASTRKAGDMNIAPSPVVAPAPQLPVAAQRTYAGGSPLGTQVVAPPPSLSGSGPSAAASGSAGRMIALSLHPAVNAPADPPAGNRRGTFAATPEGHAGASGRPGTASGSANSGSTSGGTGNKNGGAATSKGTGEVPTGLYVGPAAKSAPVTGDPAGTAPVNTVNPNLTASVHPPRVSTARPMQPDSTAKLSEAERAVFGNRRFYSVTLNMPNLNSGGGSWVIRFAELNHNSSPHDEAAPAVDLSQPMATRKVDPAYPLQLMKENVHGTVILYAVIHADGSVGNVRVLRSVDDRLDRFASEAVAQWKFDPATRNGTPVDVEATFQIPFRPTRVGSNF